MIGRLLNGALRGGALSGRRSGGYGAAPTTGGGYGGRGDLGGQVGAQVGRTLLSRLTRRR